MRGPNSIVGPSSSRILSRLSSSTSTSTRSSGTRTRTTGWTCAKCRDHQSAGFQLRARRAPTPPSFSSSSVRPYSSSTSSSQAKQKASSSSSRSGRPLVLLATTGGAAAVGLLAFGDDIYHSYEAAERAGRVGGALVICINDYRTTLGNRAKIEDHDERERLLKACHQRCAERTLRVLEKNGGIFIKLGQHLSAMNYLLPSEWTTTFVPLQDRCPVSSLASIEKMFKHDVGEDLWDYFSEFSAEPIGAASLAQVHVATIRESGQRVAVKVQHPELAQWVPLDMALTKLTFSTLKRFFPDYDLEWLSSEMEQSLPKELDFECEAQNAMRTQAYFARLRPALPLVVPQVVWARRRILVMANESGHRLDDLAYMDASGIDRDEVSAALARIFNEMIFGRGAPLHCDPHGGNIAIRKRTEAAASSGADFDIILYDHGLYRDIPEDLRLAYARMWLAVIDGDLDGMRRHVKEVAGVDEDKFELFASAITGRDFSVVRSASILTPRSAEEKRNMSATLQEGGLLVDLVQLLAHVPRIILLILKTNDLTRSLDESLHTRRGPVRQFLILARYCARTVFYAQLDEIRRLSSSASSSLLWPSNAARVMVAWLAYVRVEVKLEAFELWLRVRRVLGLRGGGEFAAPGAGLV